MKWVPVYPLRNTKQPKVNVHFYKKDIAFNFELGDVEYQLGNPKMVEGLDNFKQRFIKVLLSDKNEVISYGLHEYLPLSNNQSEFEQECEQLAKALIEHEFSDSSYSEPNGLGFSIDSINSIEKIEENEKQVLVFNLDVNGEKDPITIKVPIYLAS